MGIAVLVLKAVLPTVVGISAVVWIVAAGGLLGRSVVDRTSVQPMERIQQYTLF